MITKPKKLKPQFKTIWQKIFWYDIGMSVPPQQNDIILDMRSKVLSEVLEVQQPCPEVHSPTLPRELIALLQFWPQTGEKKLACFHFCTPRVPYAGVLTNANIFPQYSYFVRLHKELPYLKINCIQRVNFKYVKSFKLSQLRFKRILMWAHLFQSIDSK